jgi:methylaspartate mutase epsilon subunit
MSSMISGRSFGDFVARARAEGVLVVQPRLGYSTLEKMRSALLQVRNADALTVGTITVDSYTRTGDQESARMAVETDAPLNGFPISTHARATTARVLADGLHSPTFPIQVRHGSPDPCHIIEALVDSGLHATEGGPVSYCLPYGRTPLRESVPNWRRGCDILRQRTPAASEPHLETFAGSMLGQLCPPSLLVALAVLEALFFQQNGIFSVSLSYAQQTNREQDRDAVLALRRLAGEHLAGGDWHIVVYTYMGVYPKTPDGALRLLGNAAELAATTGAARLIVKTRAEAFRIPTVAENIEALEHAARAAELVDAVAGTLVNDSADELYREAKQLVEATLDHNDDVGQALVAAFALGTLDVPYCLHPDNDGVSRSGIEDGRLFFTDVGRMPLCPASPAIRGNQLSASGLLSALSYVERTYDCGEPPSFPTASVPAIDTEGGQS